MPESTDTLTLLSSSNLLALLQAGPSPCLFLLPDAPGFHIVAVTDAYLAAVGRPRHELVGQPLFEAFPDNPADPAATGVRNLRASLETVVATRAPHVMAVQRYDIRRADGRFEERYWSPRNSPVIDADGRLAYIVHHVEDVTAQVRVESERDQLLGLEAEARERNEAVQDDLRAAYARTERILESISDAFYAVDADFRFTYVNRKAEEWWGRARAELLGRHLWTEFPQAVGSEPHRLHLQAMRERRPVSFETISPVIGRWVDVSIYPEQSGGLSCYFRDITTRKRAADAERALLPRVFELSPSFLAVLRGPEHVFELANPAYGQLIGHREVLGRPIREALPEIEGQGFFELLNGVYRTGEPFIGNELSVYIQRTAGAPPEERYVNFVYQPMPATDSTARGVLVSGVDVTDLVRGRKEVEHVLRETERLAAERDTERRRLLTVLEQAPLAISIVEAPSGRMLFANPVFEKIFGRVVMATTAQSYSEHYVGYHLDGRPLASHEWAGARAVLRGEVVEGELLEIEHASGRRRVISINAAPVRDAEGRIAAGIVMFRDVTVERRIEQQLREAQRLQSVGTLAGGVAHEVNNQMTIVLGFGEFVLRALGPDHPQAADLRLVLRAGERAAHVSQQLLTFTRQQVTQLRSLGLYDVVTDLAPVLRQLLGSDKQLAIGPDRRAASIEADPTQVEQVLINLVANARDATPAGGRVTLDVADIELTEADSAEHGFGVAPGAYVLLTISDTGAGMDDATLARVFEPFFTTKGQGQGTGLGLSMVYGIVKRHGGYVWAESELGRGTTMKLYWPARPAADAKGAVHDEPGRDRPSPGSPAATPQSRVAWVVEDELAVRELIARTLRAEGFIVTTAEDGAAALHLLDQPHAPPTLVITDLIMPHVNGREVGAAVTARHPGTAVLYISGYPGEDVVRRGLVAEDAAFLQKPFALTRLLQAVGEVLGRP